MSAQTAVLEAATIGQQCKVLHLPTVAAQCAQLAERRWVRQTAEPRESELSESPGALGLRPEKR